MRSRPATLAALQGHVYRVDTPPLEDCTGFALAGRARDRSRSRAWRYVWAIVLLLGLVGWVQAWAYPQDPENIGVKEDSAGAVLSEKKAPPGAVGNPGGPR